MKWYLARRVIFLWAAPCLKFSELLENLRLKKSSALVRLFNTVLLSPKKLRFMRFDGKERLHTNINFQRTSSPLNDAFEAKIYRFGVSSALDEAMKDFRFVLLNTLRNKETVNLP